MSKTHEIKVTKRELQRKGASRRLRHAGVIPAIVYGGNAEPVAISLDHNEIWLAQQNEWFYASILDLNLDGQVQKVTWIGFFSLGGLMDIIVIPIFVLLERDLAMPFGMEWTEPLLILRTQILFC